MSTMPGDDSLRDAGLTSPEMTDAVNLAEEVTRAETGDLAQESEDPDVIEEYHPRTPRPDLEGKADEADVIEQAWTVPSDDEPES